MNSCPRAPAPVLSPNCDARLLMSSPSAEMAAVLKERSGLQRLRNSDTTGPSEDCSPDTEEMNCSQSGLSIIPCLRQPQLTLEACCSCCLPAGVSVTNSLSARVSSSEAKLGWRKY